jgi:hypothetical protein
VVDCGIHNILDFQTSVGKSLRMGYRKGRDKTRDVSIWTKGEIFVTPLQALVV